MEMPLRLLPPIDASRLLQVLHSGDGKWVRWLQDRRAQGEKNCGRVRLQSKNGQGAARPRGTAQLGKEWACATKQRLAGAFGPLSSVDCQVELLDWQLVSAQALFWKPRPLSSA